MFELIGLLIGTIVVFIIASVTGFIYGFCAWLILPKRGIKFFRLAFAFAIPVVSAAYMWLCVALLPGESLFGDIDQPLPNGYALTALGKMPEYGSIANSHLPLASHGVGGRVDLLAVNGPLVAGRYCQTCGAAFVQSKAIYFVLDTRNGQSTDCADLSEMQLQMKQPVKLVDTQFFQSQEPSYLSQQRINRLIIFTPPISATVLYFTYLILYRRRESLSVRHHLY